LILVMLASIDACCNFSCLCGHVGGTPTQQSAMTRCMNTFVRSMGGAKAAPVFCSCV
jgi:hypothetical protein